MRFALAHMSCGGAWCWDGVTALLPGAHAPDLEFTPGVTPTDHAPGRRGRPLLRLDALVVIDGFAPDSGDSAHGLKPEFAP